MTDHITIFPLKRIVGRNSLELLERENEDLRQRLESLQDKPTARGVVAGLFTRDGSRFAMIVAAGQTLEKRLAPWAKDVSVGMSVALTSEGAQPIGFSPALPGGMVVVVDKTHDGAIEFACQGVQRTAASGIECKPGDRVMLEATGMVVVKNLGSGGMAKVFSGTTGVGWDDIGGLEDVKRQLREAIEGPVAHADVYRRFGKRPCKGIALFGPPGTGKTMLGKAAATALAKAHGKSASSGGFIYVRGPELLHGIVGSSESNVRQLFASARAHEAEHGYPSIIFLDEADGLLAARGRNPWEGMERTVVPMFLAEMDGLESTGATVILATNRPDAIDPAFMRDGRIDLRIEVPPPGEAACADIFGKCLRGRPFTPEDLPKLAAAELFADRHVVRMVKNDKGRDRLTLAKSASGALVAGVVERATQRAIRRAISDGDAVLTIEDVKSSVAEILASQIAIGGET